MRPVLVDALVKLYNADVLPRVPARARSGASGDLAPLAHLSAVLLGVGEVECGGQVLARRRGPEARRASTPITLAAKEGLALLNGTQTSTALALWNLFAIDNLYATALVAGALSVDAAEGSASPSTRASTSCAAIPGRSRRRPPTASCWPDSPINSSHRECGKVQDPYCLRCQPQVMGACATRSSRARAVLLREANGVTDNPLVFAERTGRGRFRAATSTPSPWPSPPTISRWPWPRSARCPSGASRC